MPYGGEETAFISQAPADMVEAARALAGIDLHELCLEKFNK
jgi:hypothetical protein